MFYRCKNCGGNVLYDPQKKKMICESCGSEESQVLNPQEKIHVCGNCGAILEVSDSTLAQPCPYCHTYHILEDRLADAYKPDLLLPFVVDKHQAAEDLQQNISKRLFLPSNFCSASSVESMEGLYVPFWMYDIHSHVHFEGEGDRVRSWIQGEYRVTETRVFRLVRDFEVDYDKVPEDASASMEDGMMDLLEPYRYEELGDFTPEYMSGFHADVYDQDSKAIWPRAEKKANGFSEKYLRDQNIGYTAVRPFRNQKQNVPRKISYAFLPVWKYVYRYGGENYSFFVNGQTGKTVGAPPVSRGKAVGYTAILFGAVFAAILLVELAMQVDLTWLAAFLIGAAAAVIFAVVNLRGNKGKVTTDKKTYVHGGGIVMNRKEDIFLRSHVTRVRISNNNRGGRPHR